MSVFADLPASVLHLNDPDKNGPMGYREAPGLREMVMNLLVPWADMTAFRNVVVGSQVTFGSGPNAYTRVVPLQCPWDPGLYATALEGKYRGGDSAITPIRPYSHVIFSVTFGLIPYGPGSDAPYRSLQAVGALRSVTNPSEGYTFSNGEPLDHGVAIQHMTTSYLYTLYQVPDIVSAENALRELGSTPVNDSPLTIAGRTFDAGTVMLESFTTDTVQSVGGVLQSNLQVVLNWSALPWNSLVRSDGEIDEVSPQLYQTGDLSPLQNI